MPPPPIVDLLEQLFEIRPAILKNFGKEISIVRVAENNADPSPNPLVVELRISRLFYQEMSLDQLVESLMLKRRQLTVDKDLRDYRLASQRRVLRRNVQHN